MILSMDILSGKERPSIKDMCNCGGGMNARVSCTGLSEVIPQPKLLFHHSIYFSYNTTICPRKINMCMHTVFYMYIELLRIKGIIRIWEE